MRNKQPRKSRFVDGKQKARSARHQGSQFADSTSDKLGIERLQREVGNVAVRSILDQDHIRTTNALESRLALLQAGSRVQRQASDGNEGETLSPTVRGEPSTESQKKDPVSLKITRVELETSTKTHLPPCTIRGLDELKEEMAKAKKINDYIGTKPPILLSPREELPGSGQSPERMKKSLAWEALKKSLERIGELADAVEAEVNEPSVEPIKGRVVFEVAALPEGSRNIEVVAGYFVIKYYSTADFGPGGLGLTSPGEAQVGKAVFTIELNGNLGSAIFVVKTKSPEGPYLDAMHPFEIKGPVEESVKKEIWKQHANINKLADALLELWEENYFKISIALTAVGQAPYVGGVVAGSGGIGLAVQDRRVRDAVDRLRKANTQQTVKNLKAAESLPEEAHLPGDQPTKELHDLSIEGLKLQGD